MKTSINQLMMTDGLKKLSESTIIICGIVRDCGKKLKRNIQTVNQLCDLAKDYHVVIYENDSADDTKQILTEWANERKNVHVSLNNFNIVTIPENHLEVNPYYSVYRIEKMASYRNYYLEYIEKENLAGDYIIIVDLDVNKIYINGVIGSFAVCYDWDVIAANGISRSLSSKYRKQYYDSFALVACGQENFPQTEKNILEARRKWGFMRPGMPLIRVASAFGGLSIYKREAIKHCRYGVLPNNDDRVESRTEHFFFYQQMKANGYHKIFINPAMYVKYNSLSTVFVEAIRNRIFKRFG